MYCSHKYVNYNFLSLEYVIISWQKLHPLHHTMVTLWSDLSLARNHTILLSVYDFKVMSSAWNIVWFNCFHVTPSVTLYHLHVSYMLVHQWLLEMFLDYANQTVIFLLSKIPSQMLVELHVLNMDSGEKYLQRFYSRLHASRSIKRPTVGVASFIFSTKWL